MYDVKITSNYPYGVTLDGGNRLIGSPGPTEFTNWGNHMINVAGMGDILFLDIADKKLDGYTHEKLAWTKMTWGGLVRYRGLDAYFRYEGQGKIEVVIDHVGSVSLKFSHGGMIVNLADLAVV